MRTSHEALANRLSDFVNRWLAATMRSLDTDLSFEGFLIDEDVPGRIWRQRVYAMGQTLTLTRVVLTAPSDGAVHYYSENVKVPVTMNTRPVIDVQEYLEYMMLNMLALTQSLFYTITWITLVTPSGDRHGFVGTPRPLSASDFEFRRFVCG
jgi:hypothetical protein